MKLFQLFNLIIFPSWKQNIKLVNLAIASVAIGVALIVSIFNANDSIMEQFNYSNSLLQGKQTARLESISGEPFKEKDLGLPLMNELKNFEFTPVLELKVLDNKSKQSLTIIGVDLLNDYRFRHYDFEGKEAQIALLLDSDKSGLLISKNLSKKLNWQAPQESLIYNSKLLTIKINDSVNLKNLGVAKSEGGYLALADITYLQKAFGLENTYTALEFLNVSSKVLKTQLTIPNGFRLVDPSENRKEIENLTSAFRFNLQALSYIALLVAAYLISQTIFISFQRRNKLIGTLRVMGFSRQQSFGLIMLETSLIALIGIVLGCLLGLFLSQFTLNALSKTVNELYFSVKSNELILSFKGPLIASGITLLTCLLAGLPSAFLSGRVNPIISLRAFSFKNFQEIPTSLLRLLYLIGSLSLLFLYFFQNYLYSIQSKYLGFGIALIVLLGLGLISGLLLRIGLNFFSSLNNWFGQLLRLKISSNYIRLWIASGALICGLSMTISISLMIDSFRETVKDWVNNSLKADVYISSIKGTEANIHPELIPIVSNWPEIKAINYLSKHQAYVNDKIAIIGGTNLKCQLEELKFISQIPAMRNLLLNSKNYVIVSNTFASKRSLKVADTIKLNTFEGLKKLKIAGIYQDYSSEHGYMLMDRDLYLKFFKNSQISNIAFYLKPKVTFDSIKAKLATIDQQIFNSQTVKIQSNKELRKTVLKIFDQTFQVSYLFFWIALFLSIMTVALTLFSCIEENSYLNLTNRYLGTTVSQLMLIEISQSLLITLVSIILSLPGGYWLSIVLKNTINNNSFGWIIYLHPNWLNISLILILSLVGAFIGSIYPVWAARKIVVSGGGDSLSSL